MNPEQALNFLVSIAKNCVLLARQGGQPAGLTYDDHAAVGQAENVLRQAIAGPAPGEDNVVSFGNKNEGRE